MTVGELKALLAGLPEDMEVMMMDPDRGDPQEIVQVSRGSWGSDLTEAQEERLEEEYGDSDIPEEVLAGLKEYDIEQFYQDDNEGKVAVIVTW
jgi:hypothetical protein